jgi:HAD superfamily hydrolase (TIGR01484 family)
MNKKKILLFDVDGTIALSGQKINNDIKKILLALQEKNIEIGIVGGGRYEKIIHQLDDLNVKYLFAECGCVFYKNNEIIYTKNIKNHPLYNNLNILIKAVLYFISNVDYIITGHFIDLRNGLIYVSLIGMSATEDERNYFIELNNKFNYRQQLIDFLYQKAKELQINDKIKIVEGGMVGIAIFPQEWDKIQILEQFDLNDDIYYFGDKYTEQGNDYLLLHHPFIIGVPVNNPSETLSILQQYFTI